MKLKDIAAEPKLIKILLDSAEVIEEYGEALEFWTWDRQPITNFIKMANMNSEDMDDIMKVVRRLVLDEDGTEILTETSVLPNKIMLQVVQKVVEGLGK